MDNLSIAFVITVIFIIAHGTTMIVNEKFAMGHIGMFLTVFIAAFLGSFAHG